MVLIGVLGRPTRQNKLILIKLIKINKNIMVYSVLLSHSPHGCDAWNK
jgi:hypothetical protein